MSRRSFNAPLLAGAIAVVAVIAVVAWSLLAPKQRLTVDSLQHPAVAALGAGSDVYPANSKEAIGENVKFGYLPAVDTTLDADGTVVLADARTAQRALGLAKPLDQTSTADFQRASVPGPKDGSGSGTPMTWEAALDEYGDDTVFVPQVDDARTLDAVAGAVEGHGAKDSVIIRSAEVSVLKAAANKGLAGLYTGPAAVGAQRLHAEGITMAAVAHDAKDLDAWLHSDVSVWVTGAGSKDELSGLADRGVVGALTANPYAVAPAAVQTG